MLEIDYAERRLKLKKKMKEAEVDTLLITNYINVSYLTGFSGDDSYLLVTPTDEIIISDARYEETLQEECADFTLEIRRPPVKMHEAVAAVIESAKRSKIGLEASSVTLEFVTTLQEKCPKTTFTATSSIVEGLREIKDKAEVEAIRTAIRCAEKAFAVIRASLRPDRTEKNVADELEFQIRTFGGTCGSFPAIIGVGPRAALPHGRPSDKKIGESEFVLIDWGARVGQYISDLTRVLVTGKISPKLHRLYGVVLNAQLTAIEAIRPGAKMQDVDAAARDVIAKAGFGKQFGHSLGHGIGREVHESPRLAMDQDRELVPGMVVTVEPGIYIPGWGGIRIEDDILVTRTGHEVLSNVPKKFEDCIVT